jgi:DNA-binding transcriptional MerR regulator
MDTDKTFTLEELAAAAGINPRTIRYYIQLGLLEPPQGQTRAARYSFRHLRALLETRRLTEQGFSLERVAELLAQPAAAAPAAAASARPGEVSVRTHVFLAPGIELVIDPGRAGLSAAQLRQLTRALVDAHARHQSSLSHPEQEGTSP